jgi:hypothetical protein
MRDRICKSGALCDIQLVKDSLIILAENGHFIELKQDNNFGIKIIIDTTCKGEYLYKD